MRAHRNFDCRTAGVAWASWLALLLMAIPGCSRSPGAGETAGATPATVAGPASSKAELARLHVPAGGELPLAIVIGPGAEVLDFTGPLEVFAAAWTEDGHPLFKPYFVAETKEPVTVFGNMRVIPDYTFKDAPEPKVVVIPAMAGDTPAMLDWIRKVSKGTDVTMSVCNGAFILARTGLLDGRPATSHHGGYFRFAGEFPNVKLQRGARFTESDNFASSGGISSGIDLALRVVARYLGDAAAQSIADGMEYQGPGWHDSRSNMDYARMPEGDSKHPKCPLCRMDADPRITSRFKGKTYAFCSVDEKQYFDNHRDVAERFLREDAEAAASGSR